LKKFVDDETTTEEQLNRSKVTGKESMRQRKVEVGVRVLLRAKESSFTITKAPSDSLFAASALNEQISCCCCRKLHQQNVTTITSSSIRPSPSHR
jgi:hypothetical protein